MNILSKILNRTQRREVSQQRWVDRKTYFEKHITCPECGMSMNITSKGHMNGMLFTVMYECSSGHHQALYRGKFGLPTPDVEKI